MHFHRLIVAAALCAIIASAYAATTVGSLEPAAGTWRAYRGSGFTTLVCSNSSEAAMLACIAADAETRKASTRYQLRYPNRYVTVTYSAPPPPPPAETWTRCAGEGSLCSFTGTRRVRYGAQSSWIVRDITAANGGVQCDNSVFSDPLPGTWKYCELSSTVVTEPEPVPTGTASLRWTPPTKNVDGSALADLAGYRIGYGTSPTAPVHTIQVANPGASSYTVTDLPAGTWYFTARAYTSNGTESVQTPVVSKVIM